MSSGHGPFFFGAKPCSFDALLYGLLAFQQASPVTSPEMKQQVGGTRLWLCIVHAARHLGREASRAAVCSTTVVDVVFLHISQVQPAVKQAPKCCS